MLARPSVTPKDPSDYIAAYPKRLDPAEASLTAEQSRSAVRFHPEIRHGSRRIDSYDSDGEEESGREEEEFPVRRPPVKGRKQTGLFSSTKQGSDIGSTPSVSQCPKYQANKAVEVDGLGKEDDGGEMGNATKGHKGGLSMGMASKIAGAMRKTKPKRPDEPSGKVYPDQSNVSDLSTVNPIDTPGNINNSIMNTTCMTEAFAPIFAEGISLFSPKATYNAKNNKELNKNLKSLPTGKHAFAVIVDSARHHRGSSKEHSREVDKTAEIAPSARARLVELAKAAKVKAQQKRAASEGHDGQRRTRDDEPGWSCAGLDHTGLMNDVLPTIPTLAVEPATPQTLHDREGGKEYRRMHRNEYPGTIKKSASRSRLVDYEQQRNTSDELVWIGKDGREATTVEERKHHRTHSHSHHKREDRSQSRHRHHDSRCRRTAEESRREEGLQSHRNSEEGESRRAHRSHYHPDRNGSNSSLYPHHQPATTPATAGGKVAEQLLPDKRKGKVLESGAETQRLNLALTMARTRMEMEMAEQQEVEANTKMNGKGTHAKTTHFPNDDEEKAWLDEAYEEAVKKEVEYKYLYDAHSLGGAW